MNEDTAPAPKTVQLGVLTFELELPPSFAVRRDVMHAIARNPNRAYAAALGLCCTRNGDPLYKRLKVAPYSADWDVLRYGGDVEDALIAAKVNEDQVREQGKVAWHFVADSILTASEVDAAEDFTEARSEASTS